MRLPTVRTLLIAFSAAVPLVGVIAQEPTSLAPQTTRPGPWALSLGINSVELNLGTQRPGVRA